MLVRKANAAIYTRIRLQSFDSLIKEYINTPSSRRQAIVVHKAKTRLASSLEGFNFVLLD
jgi:hypothetical protein